MRVCEFRGEVWNGTAAVYWSRTLTDAVTVVVVRKVLVVV